MITPSELAEIAGQFWPEPSAGSPGVGVAVAVVGRDGTSVTTGAVDRGFALASVTKLLVAYAVLVAVEEGSLALDTPLRHERGTSLRHLLSHASGMAPDERVLLAPPATRRIYSNAGFELIGDLLTAATGIDVPTYLFEAVLAPLSMTSTTLDGSPASGATSTVDDLARFARELLAPTLVAPRTVAEATTNQLGAIDGVLPGFGRQSPNDWGLGFELRGTKHPHWMAPSAPPRAFGHFGRTGTFLWIDPDAQAGCVYLGDTDFGPWAVDAWPRFNEQVREAAVG